MMSQRNLAGGKLLIVDDDAVIRDQLTWLFQNYQSWAAEDAESALTAVRAHEPDVVLLDLGLPPEAHSTREGFRVLEAILALAPNTKINVITGQDERENAIRAVGLGACDFIAKPFEPALVKLVVDRAFYTAGLEAENRRLLVRDAPDRLPRILGDSPSLQRAARTVEKIAPVDVNVILIGESGSGKELFARALHDLSPRHAAPCEIINCTAIPAPQLDIALFGAPDAADGARTSKLAQANGGTLVLDQIGDLAPDLQVKLLRFLEERRLTGPADATPLIDLRVVAMTNHDLAGQVERGAFRGDLYYRLNEITVELPPLRERAGDAVLLARHFLHHYAQHMQRPITGFSDDALHAIDRHRWPGNVRELQNRIKRAVIMAESKRVTAQDLELDVDLDEAQSTLRMIRDRAEAEALRRALALSKGNISKASRLLGVSRPTLYDLIKQHAVRLDLASGAVTTATTAEPAA